MAALTASSSTLAPCSTGLQEAAVGALKSLIMAPENHAAVLQAGAVDVLRTVAESGTPAAV